MNKLCLYIFWIIIIFLLSACSEPSIVPTQALIITTEQNIAYPYPQYNITENPNYPPPSMAIIANPDPTSTADPLQGYIRGKLLHNYVPVSNITLYIAEVITDDTGRDMVAGLDPRKSPNTVTDSQGNFTFTNITPGRYALILDIITNQYLLNYPGKEDPIIFQVEPGREVNFGDMNFDELPVP
jgi:hypothetical protein